MTAIWGPLGWMTLHSVATIYPPEPTPEEQILMRSWLDMFRDTITCPSCRDHFSKMLEAYRQLFPNMLASRQNFALFTFRAHNAVKRRINKPVYGDVQACMDFLKTNVKNRAAREYRLAYLHHISLHWRVFRDASGISALRKIAEMNKIELEYLRVRDNGFDVTLSPDVVILPRETLEKGYQEPVMRGRVGQPPPGVSFRLTGGGIRIRR